MANATFQPLLIYGLVAMIYFTMCYPLTVGSRVLERRLAGHLDQEPHMPALDADDPPMIEMRNVTNGMATFRC